VILLKLVKLRVKEFVVTDLTLVIIEVSKIKSERICGD
jgi:hypothetical protein